MNGWDVLNNLLTSKAFLPTLLFIAGSIVVIIVGVKNGWFKYKGKGLTIGSDENERRIIRQQMEYVHTKCDSLISYLPKGLDYYRSLYVISRFEDFLQSIIIYNHIKNDTEYIQLKYEMAYALILKKTEHDYFRSDEFKKWFYDLVREIIDRLVTIRQTYSEKGK